RLEGSRAGGMSRSSVGNGSPWAIAATAPMTMNRTPWRSRTSSSRVGSNGTSATSGRDRLAERAESSRGGSCALDALARRPFERALDVREVRLVPVQHPEREVESAGPDQLEDRLEARRDRSARPARHLVLRAADAPAEPGP